MLCYVTCGISLSVSPPTCVSVTLHLGQCEVPGVSIVSVITNNISAPSPLPICSQSSTFLTIDTNTRSQSLHGRRDFSMRGVKKCWVRSPLRSNHQTIRIFDIIPVLWQFLNIIPIRHSFSETRLSFNDGNHQVRLWIVRMGVSLEISDCLFGQLILRGLGHNTRGQGQLYNKFKKW